MEKTVLVVGIIFTLILTSCSSKNKTSSKEEVQKFKVINPLVKDTIYTNEYVTEINALQNVKIRARIDGFIEKVWVDEGQTVKKGQVLFSITNKQFQQDLNKAKALTKGVLATLKSAEIELQGLKKMLQKNYISAPKYNLAKAKLKALKAKLKEAQADEAQAILNLSFTRVKAPFDGIINRIPKKVGSLVEEGVLLTTISNNKEMLAYFNVSEIDYLDFVSSKNTKKGEKISLVLANGTPYKHKGVIETIESEFNKSTGTIAFRAKFPNPNYILKHGATGKIQINTDVKNAMLIPQKVTFDLQEHLCVYVVDKNNTVHIKKITPLLRLSNFFVINSDAITKHDKIIYEGIQKVKEGDKIIPEFILF